MAVALDASSPAAVYGDTAANTSLVTASFTPPAGSIVVAKVVSADANQTHTSVTGLTFASRVNVGTAAATTRNSIWTAVGDGSAVTVTASFAGTTAPRGLVVEVWTGAQLAAAPATGSVVGGSGAPTNTITTVATGSVVSWVNGDWAAIDGASRTYRSSATETGYHFLTGQWTQYNAYQAAPSPGSQTYGLTAPVGETYTLASIEIQAVPVPTTRPSTYFAPRRNPALQRRVRFRPLLQGTAAAGAAFAQTQNDTAGLTDAAVVLDRGQVVTETTGLADSIALTTDRPVTDAAGLTDALALARGQVATDDTGLTDSTTVSFVKEQAVTDAAGLADSTVISRGYGLTQTDTEGLTDAVALDRSQSATDPATLTDAATTSLGLARTADDTTGLTDSVTIDNGKVVAQTDAVGLTDAAVLDRATVIVDPAGLTDTAALALSRPVTDNAGLTDSAIVENGKLVTATDTAGLTDSVVLQLFRAITDTAGLADLAALTRGMLVPDTTGLTDDVAVALIPAGGILTPLERTLTVAAENRALNVPAEIRDMVVDTEDRTRRIPPETRTLEA